MKLLKAKEVQKPSVSGGSFAHFSSCWEKWVAEGHSCAAARNTPQRRKTARLGRSFFAGKGIRAEKDDSRLKQRKLAVAAPEEQSHGAGAGVTDDGGTCAADFRGPGNALRRDGPWSGSSERNLTREYTPERFLVSCMA